MSTPDISLSPALRTALDLLSDPPEHPDVSKGYLDLLGGQDADASAPKNTGRIQALWASPRGSLFYDKSQALARKLFTLWQQPTEWLNIPPGGTALDIGSGPGNVTSALAAAAAPDGVAIGVDISEAMLARAVRAETGPQVGFVRADAQRLPFRDNTFDAAVSIAALQLVPDLDAAVAQIARVVRPSGRVAVMVPTVGLNARLLALLPNGGAHIFGVDELGDLFEKHGFVGVRVASFSSMQWVRAKRPD
ncbi:MAG: methyltransferase domain-containing protein [Actinobacteria bacterium]|nr:methyltransferase domain-containing protein [Actinomycetota bacterium]